MKAVRYDGFGGINVRVEEAERPVPGDGQVLVRVKAYTELEGRHTHGKIILRPLPA